MARRDLTTFNTVGDVVADVGNLPVFGEIAEVGQKWIAESQQAKIAENFSAAQLDLNKLNNQFQTDYEGDPFNEQGLKDYKAQKQSILDQYGETVNPFFRGKWNESAQQLSKQSDLTTQGWGYKQARTNTVQSLNSSIENNLKMSSLAGEQYAAQGGGLVKEFLDVTAGYENLQQTFSPLLGETTTAEQMKHVKEDSMKMFVSSVSDKDPVLGAKLLSSDDVKDKFSNPAQYREFKGAIEARAVKVQEIAGQQQVLETLKDQNSVLARSLEKPIPYAELQGLTAGMNLDAQRFFMKANGYTSAEDAIKMSPSEKLNAKAAIYDKITEYAQKEDLHADDVSSLQDTIFKAMDSKAIDEKEGLNYLNQITTPLVAQKEKQLQNYGAGKWNPFQEKIGFNGIEDYYEDHVKIGIPEAGEGEKQRKNLTPQESALNTVNKVKLYDNYMGALQGIAASYRDGEHPNGIAVGDIPNLNNSQRNKIYSEAQTEAQRLFLNDRYPALKTMPDTPNFVFDGGKLIPGMTGQRKLNADVTAPATFKTQVGSDGNLYRLYPTGKREMVGPAKGVTF